MIPGIMTTHLLAVFLSAFVFVGIGVGQQTVHLPVVVQDKSGMAIRDLSSQDFQVKEERKDQQVTSIQQFQPITLTGADGQQKRPIFLMLDLVGFQAGRTKEAVGEVLEYTAAALERGEMVSLLMIDTNGVRAIHEFSKPPQIFFAALNKVDGEKKVLGGHYSPNLPPSVTERYAQDIAAEVAGIKSITERVHATTFQGIQAQLNAFQTIAGALRATPGRKQIIWITDAFEWNPNEVESRLETKNLDRENREELKPVSIEYQKTIERLNQAHISVYPANPGGDAWVNDALLHFAVATGGTRIGYVHDPGKVVQQAISHCSTYYLVEYRPTEAVKNLRWNKLKITSEKAEHLIAPEGRFATPPQEWKD
jgi:VWFA-related protein